MQRYLGIDVHRDSSTICVLDAAGKQVRQGVVETHGEALVSWIRGLAGTLHVCIEETPWSEWIYELLSPHVARVVVYQSQWKPGAKSDAIDAHGLAEKLRTGRIGSPVFKAPGQFAKLRESARVYQMLAGDVVRAQLRLKSLYRRRGVACRGEQVYAPQLRREWVAKLPVAMRPAAELLGAELDRLCELKAQAEKAMIEECSRHRIAALLDTVPGLGPVRVALLMAIVVTPHRFRTKRQFWAYCGFGVVTRSSADWAWVDGRWARAQVVKTRGLNRNHHPALKALFKGAANTVISRSGPNRLQVAYEHLCASGTKPNLARLTIARKIAATTLAMWKHEEVYDPER